MTVTIMTTAMAIITKGTDRVSDLSIEHVYYIISLLCFKVHQQLAFGNLLLDERIPPRSSQHLP